jgi:hypothetical protein
MNSALRCRCSCYYGAARLPQIQEAVMLRSLDDLDGKQAIQISPRREWRVLRQDVPRVNSL